MDAADAQQQAITLLLRDLQDAMSEANIALAHRLRLSATDAAAIEHISLAPTAIGPAELSTRLGVTRSSATEIVDRLVEAGHLERERDESDRRRIRLVPTTPARQSVSTQIAPLLAAIDVASAEFTESDRRVISEFLTAVAVAHRRFAHEAPHA